MTKEAKRRPYSEYAFRFRKLRERSGHTQTSLSDALDTHQAVVCRIENNRKKIDMEMINEVAKAMKKTPEEIFRELNGGVTIQNNSFETHNGDGLSVRQEDLLDFGRRWAKKLAGYSIEVICEHNQHRRLLPLNTTAFCRISQTICQSGHGIGLL